jgi:exopolysaccharide biosynthesis polyprenyl glycosylphosphotransferase
VDELPKIVRERRIQRVIIAFDRTSEKDMIPVLRDCGDLPAEIHVMPRFFELGVAPDGLMTDDIWGIPLVRLRRSALRTLAWRTKRPVDIAVAGFLLLLTLPLLTLAMIAVALTSPGPIILRQKRIGERGEIFEIAKLRTLYANNGGDTSWTPSGEARTTPVGGFLRRTGIDELPQLINVIRGQMSLVGPRPERPYFAEQFRVAIGGYGDRERVPAGMTGWAQVHGLRGDTSIEERALFDNHYVEHWSPWRDLLIIARTIGVVLRGQGP